MQGNKGRRRIATLYLVWLQERSSATLLDLQGPASALECPVDLLTVA
jgi:hypothetical protein